MLLTFSEWLLERHKESARASREAAAIPGAYGGGGHAHAAGFSVPLGSKTGSPLAPISQLPMQDAKSKKRVKGKRTAR
jgi:hypothetical protein